MVCGGVFHNSLACFVVVCFIIVLKVYGGVFHNILERDSRKCIIHKGILGAKYKDT